MRATLAAALLVAALVPFAPRAAQSPPATGPAAAFDEVLDLYVRDGMVYYRALKSDRAKLDGYVASLAAVPVDRLTRDAQLAFWLNAYNALVLETIVDQYPIAGRSADYPVNSIRQVPGAFDRTVHRVGGRSLTLDQLEQSVIAGFRDPRAYLALGRGALGSTRLRSEVYAADRLEAQLTDVARECVTRPQCVQVDRDGNTVWANALFSWREKDFVAAFGAAAPKAFAARSPVERAVLGFVDPRLLTIERDFLNTNSFRFAFRPFDWSLNDLTGRGGR